MGEYNSAKKLAVISAIISIDKEYYWKVDQDLMTNF